MRPLPTYGERSHSAVPFRSVATRPLALGLALAFAAALPTTACQRAARTEAAATMPSLVIGTISSASIKQNMTQYGKVAEQIKPGSGAMLQPNLVALGLQQALGNGKGAALVDVSWDKPFHLLLTKGQPLALWVDGDAAKVAKAFPALKVESRGRAVLVGEAAAVEQVKAWALGTLVTSAAPSNLSVRFYPEHALAGFDLEPILAQMVDTLPPQQQTAMRGYYTALFDFARACQHFDASLEVSDARIEMVMSAQPKADSAVAAFVAAQKPYDFGVLKKVALPNELILAGRFDLSLVRDSLFRFYEAALPGNEAMQALVKLWLPEGPISVAMAASMFDGQGMRGSMISELPNDDAAPQQIEAMAKSIGPSPLSYETNGVKVTQTLVASGALENAKYAILDTRSELPTTTPQAQALLDKLGTTASRASFAADGSQVVTAFSRPDAGGDVTAPLKAAMQTARAANSVAPAWLAAEVATATARRESVLMTMDMAGYFALLRSVTGGGLPALPADTAPRLRVGVGFSDKRIAVRVGMDVADIAAMVRAFSAAAPPTPAAPAPSPAAPSPSTP